MKNTTIKQAVELGFDFQQFTDDSTIKEIMEVISEFMDESSEALPQQEDECEVTGGRSQNVNYGDYTCSGEIVDFAAHWSKDAETKIFHSNFVAMGKDGTFYRMNLYYLVGKTEYNAPDGFRYSEKAKDWVKEEA